MVGRRGERQEETEGQGSKDGRTRDKKEGEKSQVETDKGRRRTLHERVLDEIKRSHPGLLHQSLMLLIACVAEASRISTCTHAYQSLMHAYRVGRMYVCVCVCMCACVYGAAYFYAHVYVSLYIYTHIYIYICVCVSTCVYMYVCMPMQVSVCVHMCLDL